VGPRNQQFNGLPSGEPFFSGTPGNSAKHYFAPDDLIRPQSKDRRELVKGPRYTYIWGMDLPALLDHLNECVSEFVGQ
jgi:hypothetical protein